VQRMYNNRVVQIRKRQNLRIDIKRARVVKRQIQTLLRLQRRHEIAAPSY
jgi:hypothetical protein